MLFNFIICNITSFVVVLYKHHSAVVDTHMHIKLYFTVINQSLATRQLIKNCFFFVMTFNLVVLTL